MGREATKPDFKSFFNNQFGSGGKVGLLATDKKAHELAVFVAWS